MMKMKRMIRYIFMLLAIFFANNMIAQVTLNLHPNATNGIDALIDNSSATTNYGTSPDLAAWAWTSGGITIARGLLKFDLSSIPSTATITSATLSLYCNTASSVTQLNSGANACLLQRITSTWTESGVTWNNQPTTTTVNQDTLAQSTSTTQNYPSIDVRNLVIDMINNPSTSFGFMMKLITESTYRSMVLSSSDNSDSTKWPRLVIVYTAANNYYSKSTGSLDSLSTWGPNTNGTGTSPTSFGNNNTIYNVVNNSSPTISNNWYITGTNTAVVFGDGTNTLNTSIPSGLAFGADSIYVRNNVTYTVLGTLITNKPGFENGSTVQYTASGTQNILPATFYNLVVSGGTKSLVSNTTIKGTLAMLTNINCGTNTLTIGTSATQTGSITYGSGIITGNLSRWFSASTNSGSTGLFPIGASSIYRPIQIEYTSSPSSGGILTAIFTPTNPGSSGLNPALTDFSISPIVSVNKAGPNGYWTITPSSGISGGTYTTTVTGTGFYGISSVTGLRLLRRSSSSSSWALTGSAVTPTGTTTIPVVSRTSITSIGGDFGIGADSSVNPLPIIITEFEAKVISKNNVQLNWITSSEINNNYFEVERSVDGSQFTAIGKVDGNGTTNSISSYQFTDHSLSSVNREQSTIYYRLKQVDFDGKLEYSKTVSVNINSLQQPTSIYPNPSDGSFIIENDVEQNSNITFTLINLMGEKVWSNFYQLQAGKNSIEVKATTLSPGIYFLRIEDESKQIIEVRKVLLK